MNPALTNRVLSLYHRCYPSYPHPSTIQELVCYSLNCSKIPTIALSDVFGLLVAYRITPAGTLEEVVPFPMRVPIQPQSDRRRMMVWGLPSMPSSEEAMQHISDPVRLEMIRESLCVRYIKGNGAEGSYGHQIDSHKTARTQNEVETYCGVANTAEYKRKLLAVKAATLKIINTIQALNADLRQGHLTDVDPMFGRALSSVDKEVLIRAGIRREQLIPIQ